MEKTLTEAAQLLQKISKGAAMRRDWETRNSASHEHESQPAVLAGIFRKDTPESKKEQPMHQKDMGATRDEDVTVQVQEKKTREKKEEAWQMQNH